MPAEITVTRKIKILCANCQKAVNGVLKDDVLEIESCQKCRRKLMIEGLRDITDALETKET